MNIVPCASGGDPKVRAEQSHLAKIGEWTPFDSDEPSARFEFDRACVRKISAVERG